MTLLPTFPQLAEVESSKRMSNFIQLTFDALNVSETVDMVSDASTGALSLFIGTTRDHFDGRTVVKLVSQIANVEN